MAGHRILRDAKDRNVNVRNAEECAERWLEMIETLGGFS